MSYVDRKSTSEVCRDDGDVNHGKYHYCQVPSTVTVSHQRTPLPVKVDMGCEKWTCCQIVIIML
jgi:hypothetical protein